MARVLIVDDDPDVVEAVRLLLQQQGHHVESACNREDGMRRATEDGPDLLILDIMMVSPDDGIVMAQDLRKGGFDKPILMMSSISKASGFRYGKDEAVTPVDDFVEKPVRPDVLIAKTNALLAGALG